jgi:hypothetical protein
MTTTPSKTPAADPTVYICEQQAFDYSPATVYGPNLRFIEAKQLAPQSPGAPDTWNKNVIHQIRKEMQDYIPGFDYVIPTGSPSRMLVVGMVMAEKGQKHRILKWDGRAQRYLQYDVTL